jgi:hypothetical protein
LVLTERQETAHLVYEVVATDDRVCEALDAKWCEPRFAPSEITFDTLKALVCLLVKHFISLCMDRQGVWIGLELFFQLGKKGSQDLPGEVFGRCTGIKTTDLDKCGDHIPIGEFSLSAVKPFE